VLLTPIPYDDIAYLVALLLFTAIEYTFLVEFSSDVFDNRSDLACILYNAESASEAQVNFRTALSLLLEEHTEWLEIERAFVRNAYEHMTPTDAFNQLFTNGPTTNNGSDCSACTEASILWSINVLICTPTVISGIFTEGSPVVIDNCEGNYFGTVRAGINTGAQPEETIERSVLVEILSGGGNYYVTSREGGIDISNPMTAAELDGTTFECSQLQVIRLDASDVTPFRLQITVSEL
jgi:hypothetical protein